MSVRELALTPRAMAVLVALRKGLRSTAAISAAIADESTTETRSLLQLMAVGIDGRMLVVQCGSGGSGGRIWGLTNDGIGWLQSHGLDATSAAKQALYDAIDVQTAVRS